MHRAASEAKARRHAEREALAGRAAQNAAMELDAAMVLQAAVRGNAGRGIAERRRLCVELDAKGW